jgi:glycosyltransferase involved in cell wall biosynthesis
MREADGVAVIHDRFKTRIERDFGLASERVTVIRNWTHVQVVEPFDREEFRKSMGWRPDDVIVLHAGAMGEKQGLGNVVEAARVAEAQGNPTRFVLLGDGSQRRALEARAAGCSRIEFLDPLPGDDYGRAMKSADILLVNERPGLVEMAVPSKLTSYFSTGVPVLAATGAWSTTANEVVASGAGILVEPGVPEALVAGALRLSEDRALARTIGAHGPSYCESILSEQAALDSLNAWVFDLAAQRNKRLGWHD